MLKNTAQHAVDSAGGAAVQTVECNCGQGHACMKGFRVLQDLFLHLHGHAEALVQGPGATARDRLPQAVHQACSESVGAIMTGN